MAHGSVNAVKEETFEGVGGLKIFLRSWQPVSKPRAVVVICHGVNSHGSQYIGVAEQFAASGLAAYALDLRGRGKWDGARFYVDNISEYVSDVAATIKLAKSRDSGLPVFLLGHSAGGVVSCTTRSITRPSSRGSSAGASPSRCRPRILRWPSSRG